MTPKRSPASPSEPSPTPLFDFAADSPASTPPSAPTQAPKRGRRAKATQETESPQAPKRGRRPKATQETESPQAPKRIRRPKATLVPSPTAGAKSRNVKAAKKSQSCRLLEKINRLSITVDISAKEVNIIVGARKAKKVANATPQELPPNERPFAVPKNWLWTRLGDVAKLSKEKETDFSAPNLKYVGLEHFEKNGGLNDCGSGADIRSAKNVFHEGQILYGKLRPYLNKHDVAPFDGVCSTDILVFDVGNKVDKRLFNLYLSEKGFIAYADSHSKGDMPRVAPAVILAAPFPLPPLAEQARIVALVERLFARLDEAAEIVRETLDASEERRSALLRSAFSGALTAQWREKHGVGLETWRQTKFSALCEVVRGGSPRPAGDPTYYDGDIPFLKVADITRNEGPYVYEAQYSIKEAGLKKTRMVEANTLLLTNSGATLGVPAICAFKTTFNDGVAAFLNLPSENLLFYYYFWTSKTAELRAINKGVAQPNLNTDIIGATPINLPSVAEQAEIVRLLDAAFEKERRVCELAEETAAQIETLKKAILARAFRGELGTTAPTDPKPFATAPTT